MLTPKYHIVFKKTGYYSTMIHCALQINWGLVYSATQITGNSAILSYNSCHAISCLVKIIFKIYTDGQQNTSEISKRQKVRSG